MSERTGEYKMWLMVIAGFLLLITAWAVMFSVARRFSPETVEPEIAPRGSFDPFQHRDGPFTKCGCHARMIDLASGDIHPAGDFRTPAHTGFKSVPGDPQRVGHGCIG